MSMNMPTGAPTGDSASVGGLPQTVPAVGDPVNPAQASQSIPPLPVNTQVPTSDVSGIVASYEARLRNLMSQKDTALNERNQSIEQQANLQRLYTELQTSAQNGLQSSTSAAQQAIDEANRLRARSAELEGQLLRAQVLQEHPELIPYGDYIPVSSDPEKIKESVTRLQQIRERDIQAARGLPFQQQANGQPGAANGLPYTPPANAPGSPPVPTPQQVAALYAGRSSLSPTMMQQIPASSPAYMNPMGAGQQLDAISKLLTDARESGDPVRFEAAVKQAAAMADAQVAQQMGRM